jgi:small conductance mechanosensitive channel
MGWIWFGIWFTLKTFLTNFISWIIIVSQGSYHIWDLIEIGAQRGRITKIQALFTEIEELDGTIFNIPNIRFFEENVRNFHTNDKRRIDVEVVVWYETDILQAKKVLQKVVSNFPMVLSAPASDVIIGNLWDKGVELTLRFWVSSKENYVTLKSNVTETVNLAFKQTNIHIPYPQITLSWTLNK